MLFGWLMSVNNLNYIKNDWNCLIVGGGITGSAIFRDLCLHEIDTLIIDRGDFSSQTSQASSKMLHGGIRYLETMDFGLVYEALHEKNLWMKQSPHLVKERSFILPIYKNSGKSLPMIKLGLFLYDFLSEFTNTPHKILTKEEVLKLFPYLKKEGLEGAGLYYDCVMDDSKMALEVLYDSLDRKKDNKALNYVAISDISLQRDGSYKCLLTDTITKQTKQMTCKYLIFATGPFTDKILKDIPFIKWENKLRPTKGSHLYLRKDVLKIKHAVVLITRDKQNERIIFLIPQKEKTLVGTTEVHPQEDFFNPVISSEEEQYLLNQIRFYFPESNVSSSDIISHFSGIRPLVRTRGQRTSTKTTRKHKIYQPRSTMFIIVGGKYTTFRVMAQDLVRSLFQHKGQAYRAHLSCLPLKKKSMVSSFENTHLSKEIIEDIIKNEFPRTLNDLILRRIGIRSYKESSSHIRDIIVTTPSINALYISNEMREKWMT